MRLGGWGGVKGPRSNNMPRAPRNVNPALAEHVQCDVFLSLEELNSQLAYNLCKLWPRVVLKQWLFVAKL
jgi:hypothetical protein